VESGAWPFLVGGSIRLVYSVNERDLDQPNSSTNLGRPSGTVPSVRSRAGTNPSAGVASYSWGKGDRNPRVRRTVGATWRDHPPLQVGGRSRPKQVCDALRCSGLHARYSDTNNELLSFPEGGGESLNFVAVGTDHCNY
jgi:hypothetical protein